MKRAMKYKNNKKPQSPTNRLTKSIIDYLNLSGFVAFRINNGGIYDASKGVFRTITTGRKGISDILGVRKSDGKFVAVEVKTGKDKLSVEQILFLGDIQKSNGIVIIAKTFDTFVEQLNALLNDEKAKSQSSIDIFKKVSNLRKKRYSIYDTKRGSTRISLLQ